MARENCKVLTAARAEMDLRRQADVEAWMERERPQAVFLAAATVGGILANSTRPAEFLYDNLAIETNIIHAAHRTGAEKLLLLGSCPAPDRRFGSQPQMRLRERLAYPARSLPRFRPSLAAIGRFPKETCAALISYGAFLLTMIKIVLTVPIFFVSFNQ